MRERERVDHRRQLGAEAFALRGARGDHERELGGARFVEAAQIGIAGERAVDVEQERMVAIGEQLAVMLDDIVGR